MIGLEPIIIDRKPDVALVYGDVNSMVATALVCAKLLVSSGHVKSGRVPPLWDGHAGDQISAALASWDRGRLTI